MKFYIGSPNGSGIEANSFEDFVEYLRDMANTAEKQKEEYFEVNVENYLTDEAPVKEFGEMPIPSIKPQINDKPLLNRDLRTLYYAPDAFCCKCGTNLSDANGMVGSVFVMDKCGNFYCCDCDKDFKDGDERIFEPEFCENDGKELADRIVNDEDMYNPETGVYAFHYNDKDAICVYHLSVDEAVKLANEARRAGDYWSTLLGIGGTIFDNPEDFVQSYGVEDGWITCDEFLLNHLVFKDDKEAKAWGQNQPAGKEEYINCKIGDENVILCQTNLVYEDTVWNASFDIMRFLISMLPEQPANPDDFVDEASELRDKALELFQDTFNVRIVHVFDEC